MFRDAVGGITVLGKGAATAVGNLLRVASESMEGEDQTMGSVLAVVARNPEDVFTVLAVDLGSVRSTAKRGRLATAGRAGTEDRRGARQRQDGNG